MVNALFWASNSKSEALGFGLIFVAAAAATLGYSTLEVFFSKSRPPLSASPSVTKGIPEDKAVHPPSDHLISPPSIEPIGNVQRDSGPQRVPDESPMSISTGGKGEDAKLKKFSFEMEETRNLTLIQNNMLGKKYPLPSQCKNVVWAISILLIIGCSVGVMLCGIFFDIKDVRNVSNDLVVATTSDCQGADVTFENYLSLQATNQYFEDNPEKNGKDIYGEDANDSTVFFASIVIAEIVALVIGSFLMSCFASFYEKYRPKEEIEIEFLKSTVKESLFINNPSHIFLLHIKS